MKFIRGCWQWLLAPEHRLLSVTLLYYAATYFVNANIWLLLLTAGYIASLIYLTKDVVLSLWLALLVTLPLAKGKTLPLTLIPKTDLISRGAVFDVNYIFSLYLADGVLGLLVWQLWKRWREQKPKNPASAQTIFTLSPPLWQQRGLWIAWGVFLLVAILPHWHNNLNLVILLSVLQLGKLSLVFGLPGWLAKLKIRNYWDATVQIIIAGLMFQATWSLAQYWHGGPLNRYIEAILPLGATNSAMALSTLENRDVLRVTGSFFDPSLLGTYLFTTMTWLWTGYRQSKQPSGLVWLTLLLGCLTIILTSNRVLIGLLVILVWLLLRRPLQSGNKAALKKWFRSKIGLSLSGLALLGLVVLAPYLWTRFQSLQTVFDRYGSATYRLQLGWYALRLGSTEPWGVGLNLSPYFLATGFNQETVSFDPAHPHNLFLQLWAETGWLGLGCVLLWLYLVYRPVKTQAGGNWQMSAWGWGGLAFLICAQFYPVFINQIEVMSWLAIMAGGHWASRHQPKLRSLTSRRLA